MTFGAIGGRLFVELQRNSNVPVRRERAKNAPLEGVSVYKHARSRQPCGGSGLAAVAGADVAGRAGAQVVDILARGARDLGGVRHHTQVAR